MNNDLISRSELKKAIQKLEEEPDYQHEGETWQNGLCMAEILIDNAPMVEGYKNVIVGGMNNPYNAGYMDGIRQAYEELARPQGQWIIDGHHIRCNRCNEYICNTDREGNKIPDSFCPNCGADMRETESARPDTISCFNCKHFRKQISDNPCYACNKQFSKWEEEK